MERTHILMLILSIVVITAISCTKQAATPTVTPATSTPPQTITQTPTPAPPFFGSLNDILAAYADGFLDKTFTPFELYLKMGGTPPKDNPYPIVLPALSSKENKPLQTIGKGSPALLIDKYVIFNPITTTVSYPMLPLVLVFGVLPDGRPDYEVLAKSKGKHETSFFEIYERNPNPAHPFPPATLPFPIAELERIRSEGNQSASPVLMFYGLKEATTGDYNLTEKRASIAAVYKERSVIALDGTVTDPDYGAYIFAFECGAPRFAGMVGGSHIEKGRETEALAIGIEEVIRFFEEKTGVKIKSPSKSAGCAAQNLLRKERLINALSNGRYDFSYDLCDLKNCTFKELAQFSRPFEVIDREKSEIVIQRQILLIDQYLAVFAYSGFKQMVSNDPDGSRYLFRILWGGAFDGKEGKEFQLEYLRLVGFDKTERVALFERPKTGGFPSPPPLSSFAGTAKGLKRGNVLYSFGVVDFSLFAKAGSALPLFQSINPINVIGFEEEENPLSSFFIQGTIRELSLGGVVCAPRDGICQIVGFLYGRLLNPGDETLRTALSIDFVLKAIDEISCEHALPRCPVPKLAAQGALISGSGFRDDQTVKDRDQIMSLLKDGREDLTLFLLEMLGGYDEKIFSYQNNPRIRIVYMRETPVPQEISMGMGTLVISDEYLITSSAFLPQEPFQIFLEQERTPYARKDLEELEVVFIDQENGYALLKREKRDPIPGEKSSRSLISSNQAVLVAYSHAQGQKDGTFLMTPLVLTGSLAYGSPENPKFIVNAFSALENLGSPIYCVRDGEPILCAMLMFVFPEYIPQVQTEGVGLSLDFILRTIKQKTGIDLRS